MSINIPKHYQCPAVIIFCLLAVGLLFVKCFSHDWTYDDTPVILNNQDIRSLANFFADQYPGRPLRELSYWLDYQIWGLQPGGFMVQNLFWHGLCAGLLGCLLLRFGMLWHWALLGSLLFLSHPLTVEVAANNGHRKDSLCLAFILLAVLFHLQACREGRARWFWLGAAVAAFVLASLAKQHGLLTPLIWIAAELTMVPRPQRLLARYRWPLAILAGTGVAGGAICLLFFDGWQRLQVGAATLLLKYNYLETPTLDAYYRMVAKSWTVVIGKILWPLSLAPEYTFSVPDSFLDPWVLAAFALSGFFLAGGFWLWRKRPLWLYAWLWIGLFWLPLMNLWPLAYLVADRYLYTPLVGVVMLLVLAGSELAVRWRVPVYGLLLVALVGNFWLTWQQVDVWQSKQTLWTHVSRVSPLSATAFINLSSQAINIERDFAKGRDYASRAVALNPRHPMARKNLAVALERLGQDAEAAREYLAAYELFRDKNHPVAREIRVHLARNFRIYLP